MTNIKKSRLQNGITVITERIDSVRSFSLGFWVVVGSRNEGKNAKGISHFIEHSVFKGTKKRSSKEIAEALESKGGAIDAFTSKEVTCYYSRGLSRHLEIATEVTSELVTKPLFPKNELKKEIGVVTEEIKDNEDSPQKYIFDLLFKKIFSRHPLGNFVLGRKSDVRRFTRDKVRSYFNKWYKKNRIIIAASGYLEHKKFLNLIKKSLPGSKLKSRPLFSRNEVSYKPFSYAFKKPGLLQTHLIIAAPTFDLNDSRRYPLLIFDTIMGDGMSSILFQKVREEKGLVYDVFSFANFFSDTGVFGVYLACDPVKMETAKKTVIKLFKKLSTEGLRKMKIEEAKDRLKAKLLIGQESTSNRMVRLGRGEIYQRKILTIDEIVSKINRVKTGDVNDVLRNVLQEDRLSFLYVGNTSKQVKQNNIN